MKFVATRDFHNSPELNLKLDEKVVGFKGANIVHQGHRFEVAPEAKTLKGVVKEADKQVISKLLLYGFAVVDDGTPESKEAIAAIDAEVKPAAVKPAAVPKKGSE